MLIPEPFFSVGEINKKHLLMKNCYIVRLGSGSSTEQINGGRASACFPLN